MSFQIDEKDNYAVITVQEEKLDTTVAPSLKSQIVYLNTKGMNNMVINLSDVRYCDSSGLSAILVANRLCANNGGSFVVTSLQDAVKKLISISQLDTILNIAPTLEEGIEMLFMDQVEKDLGDEGAEE